MVKAWLDEQEDELAFCRVTQMALLRLMTNPAMTGTDALSRRAAWERVEQLMTDSRVRFLTEPDGLVPLWVAFSKRDDTITCCGRTIIWRPSLRLRMPS